jgi:FAD synthase
MKLLSIDDYLPAEKSTVLSVGNFDGVHRGHQLLIKEVINRARQKGVASALVTFEPHTRAALYPELPQHLLTTFEEKCTLIEKSGIDYLFKIPFDKTFSETSPESFVENHLISRFHMVEWIMGEGHAIGKNRSGGKKFLRDTMDNIIFQCLR